MDHAVHYSLQKSLCMDIRARLCVREFKDVDATNLASYAGTSQRYSQRLLASEAVQRGWEMCTTDINKAFLQGVTYEELAKLTGEPLREVNFYLPHGSVPILQKLSGFSQRGRITFKNLS